MAVTCAPSAFASCIACFAALSESCEPSVAMRTCLNIGQPVLSRRISHGLRQYDPLIDSETKRRCELAAIHEAAHDRGKVRACAEEIHVLGDDRGICGSVENALLVRRVAHLREIRDVDEVEWRSTDEVL